MIVGSGIDIAEVPRLERTIARYMEWMRPFEGTGDYLRVAEEAMRGQGVVRKARVRG